MLNETAGAVVFDGGVKPPFSLRTAFILRARL
jgi:hypothetical protein